MLCFICDVVFKFVGWIKIILTLHNLKNTWNIFLLKPMKTQDFLCNDLTCDRDRLLFWNATFCFLKTVWLNPPEHQRQTHVLSLGSSLLDPGEPVQGHIRGSVFPGGSERGLGHVRELQVLWSRNNICSHRQEPEHQWNIRELAEIEPLCSLVLILSHQMFSASSKPLRPVISEFRRNSTEPQYHLDIFRSTLQYKGGRTQSSKKEMDLELIKLRIKPRSRPVMAVPSIGIPVPSSYTGVTATSYSVWEMRPVRGSVVMSPSTSAWPEDQLYISTLIII